MSASVLVAYATRYGSTQEVAEFIAATLREGGLDVDLQAMNKVRSLNDYRAVVLGAPFYMFRWHKDARSFLARHHVALAERAVALFALGPLPGTDEKGWQGCRDQFDKELTHYPWLHPTAQEMFGGKFDPAALRFPYKYIPAMKRLPAGDVRDWPTIRAWGCALAARLQPALKQESTPT